MLEQTGPRPLHVAASIIDQNVGDEALRAYLAEAGPDDALRKRMLLVLSDWDSLTDAPWVDGTGENTPARREVINQLLKIDDKTAAFLIGEFPIAGLDGNIVIADSWKPWY